MVKKYALAITNINGKRVNTLTFNTKAEAEKAKNKMLNIKKSGIKRKGKSILTGFNPRVVKI